MNVTQKILKEHIISGSPVKGEEITIKVDQTLTQDATGTLTYLEFEAIGVNKVKTKLSVSYVDHNMLQTGFENSDDHIYLQTVAQKFGIHFSKPGNGICHQVHLERFAVPGDVLLGSDSHTPTAGGICMLAIGAGGLDIAVAMAKGEFRFIMPEVVNVILKGRLKPYVSAKDVALEVLRRVSVKGGTGKIFEYTGDVKYLSVPERATIANMAVEAGVLTAIFPSDELTKRFLIAQGRRKSWKRLFPDNDAEYDETIEIDLQKLEPLIAMPHLPDNVCRVKEVEGIKINQVCIGSCTNSSYIDLIKAAKILKNRRVHQDVSMTVTPGSKQVLEMIVKENAFRNIIRSGARILELSCGPCIGLGQAPPSGGVSIRTFNRNFKGRTGTKDADVYLSSIETACASAIFGEITDPRRLGTQFVGARPKVAMPNRFIIDDSIIIFPSKKFKNMEIKRGPNIVPLPKMDQLTSNVCGKVLIKLPNNITTDDILPAGSLTLHLRSNIPAISLYAFHNIKKDFQDVAKKQEGGIVIAGLNYGQGSSREHAALALRYLGVGFIIARSYSRIHRANLINFGIIPLLFVDSDDYENIDEGDTLEIKDIRKKIGGDKYLEIENITKKSSIKTSHNLTNRDIDIILAGGLLNYIS